jgi:hypothetical protein
MSSITWDAQIAEVYDETYAAGFADAVLGPLTGLLAELAGRGPALEFAIGTGRVALPLRARGIAVRGIELSPAMAERLAAKPGADAIPVTVGDMTATRVPGTFGLVYLVANTIMNLTTQEAQVACFENAAAHLEPGGCFVVEVMVPALRRLPPGETVVPFAWTPTHVGFEEYEVATQIAVSHHWWELDGRLDSFSAPFRYVWPSELDLMARIAGLSLRERWAGWRREPFTGESAMHVSVWEKHG